MRFTTVRLSNFAPFAECEIQLPHKIDSQLAETQIFVGENGTGKSRLLSLLLASGGDLFELRRRGVHDGTGDSWVMAECKGETRVWAQRKNSTFNNIHDMYRFSDANQGGTLTNSFSSIGGTDGPIVAFKGNSLLRSQQIQPLNKLEQLEKFSALEFEHTETRDALVSQSLSNIKLKAAMALVNGEDLGSNRDVGLTKRIESTLSAITGQTFSLRLRTSPNVSLIVEWGGKSMTIDQLPDGLRSIMAWILGCTTLLDAKYPQTDDPLSTPLIVLLDEPETHLHPAWQRKILPAFQRMLPNAQFIVSTHSPFVISSVNSGFIHLLKPTANGVIVEPAEACSPGDTFLDVVEGFLGVKEWYDPETEELLENFRNLRNLAIHKLDSELLNEAMALGQSIASRSASLQEIMGRELRQLLTNFTKLTGNGNAQTDSP